MTQPNTRKDLSLTSRGLEEVGSSDTVSNFQKPWYIHSSFKFFKKLKKWETLICRLGDESIEGNYPSAQMQNFFNIHWG